WKNVGNVLPTNAYNDFNKNVFVILLGILQPPFFDANSRNCMNIAKIGTVVAHEIFHAFDDQGRQFDKFGNLRNWWDNETNNAFLDRQQCVIKQYNKYFVSQVGRYVNGINTQGENIADIAAVVTAYKTFKRMVKNKQCEICSRSSIKYNVDELFWIQYGQLYCGNTQKETLLRQVLSDPHSPNEFRVIGPLSDSIDFSKSFNCPKESQGNPTEKCVFL
ncbi:hypothetical protein B4U80_05213, partial [Leptotrombidium deliense]